MFFSTQSLIDSSECTCIFVMHTMYDILSFIMVVYDIKCVVVVFCLNSPTT